VNLLPVQRWLPCLGGDFVNGIGYNTTQHKGCAVKLRFVIKGLCFMKENWCFVPHQICPHKGAVVGCRVPIALKLSFVYFSTTMALKPSLAGYLGAYPFQASKTNYKPLNTVSVIFTLSSNFQFIFAQRLIFRLLINHSSSLITSG